MYAACTDAVRNHMHEAHTNFTVSVSASSDDTITKNRFLGWITNNQKHVHELLILYT